MLDVLKNTVAIIRDYGKRACDMVAEGTADYGILVCGTGIGMSMVANRNPKIRAGLCKDMETAQLTRVPITMPMYCVWVQELLTVIPLKL